MLINTAVNCFRTCDDKLTLVSLSFTLFPDKIDLAVTRLINEEISLLSCDCPSVHCHSKKKLEKRNVLVGLGYLGKRKNLDFWGL